MRWRSGAQRLAEVAQTAATTMADEKPKVRTEWLLYIFLVHAYVMHKLLILSEQFPCKEIETGKLEATVLASG